MSDLGFFEPTSAVFVTCQIGADPDLIREFGKVVPRLKPAFRRPGFATFKADSPITAEEFKKLSELPLVRRIAYSIGKFDETKTELTQALIDSGVRIHVFSRLEQNAEKPTEITEVAARVTALQKKFGANAGPVARLDTDDKAPIIDLIEVDPGQIWWGYHPRVGAFGEALRGALCTGEGSHTVPSRAYWKCLWLMQFAESLGVKLMATEKALEIGAAPGGAVLALAEKGLYVAGVDKAELDPEVLRRWGDSIVHYPCSADELEMSDLGDEPNIDWILIDIHAEPLTALSVIRRMIDKGLRIREGGLLTLKLNQWGFYKNRIQWERILGEMGFPGVRMVQLSVHHQELGVVISRRAFSE